MEFKSIYDIETIDHHFKAEKNHINLICGIAKEINARIDEIVCEKLGSRPSARSILCALGRYDGVNQLDLGRVTALKPATISVTVSQMEKAGIVRKEDDKYDLRAVRVFLTDDGRELYNSVKLLLDECTARALEGLSSGNAEAFLETLSQVSENLIPPDQLSTFIY